MQQQIAVSGKENALWLLEKLVPGTGINNIGVAVHVDGRLRADLLAAAVREVITKHEILRTVFAATDAELSKRVAPAEQIEVVIERLELSEDRYQDDLSAFVGRPFELDGRLLFRAGLASLLAGDILCVTFHHLIFDAISAAAFVPLLIAVYDAFAAGLPVPLEVPVQRADNPGPAPRGTTVDYWQENLRGYAADAFDLWCGSARTRNPLLPGEIVRHVLSAEGQSAVQRLQREVRAPVAAILLAAYYALLTSHGAGPDLVIGSPLDVREPRSAPAMGYHVNVVPLRLCVELTEGFRQLARRARDTFLAAMAHSDVSVDDLTAELPRTGSSWQTTLYRHVFNYLPEISSAEFALGGMTARMLTVENGYSKFDLELSVVPSRAEIWFRYCSEILARGDVEALLRRYEAMLIVAARDADRPVGEYAGWSDLDRELIDRANETAGTRAFVLAPDGRELPIGVRGELCVAGTEEGSGSQPEPHCQYGPYTRTGELARWRPDGTVERLGPLAATTAEDQAAAPDVSDADDPVLAELTDLWRQLLTADVTEQTNFFTAGGHSLLAAKLAQDIEQLTGVHLELAEIFDHPTPAALAARLKPAA